jgi:hypothetical protein
MEQTPTLQQPHHVVVLAKQKSVATALLLSFFFGPLGLLYASVAGGIVMILLSIIIGIFTVGIGLIFTWIVSIIWAVLAVQMSNKKTAQRASTLR